jgi:hypothetical protein
MRACLLRARPPVVCPGRLRLVLQSGLDECAHGPCGDLRLFVWRESAQVLKDDQCLPSDDHCQGGYQALEADVVEAAAQRLDRGLDPVDPPLAALRLPRALAAHSAKSMTAGLRESRRSGRAGPYALGLTA